jgi:hypothetical protein
MNNKYWIVRPIINGFELTTIMYGSEESLRIYIENSFKCPINYTDVDYSNVRLLEQLGFKVYCVPNHEINNDDSGIDTKGGA